MRDIVITSSVLITAVLFIRFLARGKINPILQYALWLPVALRLMLPMPLYSSSISILNFLPAGLTRENNDVIKDSPTGNGIPAIDDISNISADNATANPLSDNSGNVYPATETFSQDGNASGNIVTDNAVGGGAGIFPMLTDVIKSGSVDTVFTLIWITGMVCSGGYMLLYQLKWKKYIRENARPLKGREKYGDKLSVYTVKGLPSPCLSGHGIYLTKEMAADERQLEHILMHEYCHYRHLDSLWVIVRCVLTAVYWFHPLVWAAAYLSKQDSELACDEAALRQLGEKERIAYGRTLLALIVEEPCRKNKIGIASTMSGKEKGIRERIVKIAGKRRYAAAVSAIVIIVAAALAAVTFSGRNRADDEPEASADKIEETEHDWEAGDKALQEDLEQQRLLLEDEVAQEKERIAEMEAHYEQETRCAGVLSLLSAYDERITIVDSHETIADAKNPADYVQAYYAGGTDALDEDIYLLENKKVSDNADIQIYGMYTKEFGLRGIKVLIGGDVTNFDEEWILSGHGREDNIAVYELAENGMPRTFAWQAQTVNDSSSEVWKLYLCDRYDSGAMAMFILDREEVLEKIQERISFDIIPSECKIEVYDNEKSVGQAALPASVSSIEKITDVTCDGTAVGYILGDEEKELRMLTTLSLKIEQTDEVWYRGLPFLSFPIECGYFGERKFQIGEAAVDTEHGHQHWQNSRSMDEWARTSKDISEETFKDTSEDVSENILAEAFQSEKGHYDVSIRYQNPCPDAARISDTFGERVHPVTQEKRVHNGIDFAAPDGTDVLAAADGVVIRCGYDSISGNYVVLYHELSGEFTYYAACKEILVSEGETVKAGDKIATVGSTGRSTGTHLHFALSRDGEYIEPVFE